MIRKLSQKDHDIVMEYLLPEKEFNLFIIGDIENFGYEQEFMDIWGDFQGNQITGILLRYFDSFIAYSKDLNFDAEGFCQILNKYDKINFLWGKKEVLEVFEGIKDFNMKKQKETYFAKIDKLSDIKFLKNADKVKHATLEDVDRIIELNNQIEEFSNTPSVRESIIKNLENKTGRVYYIEEDGKMVSKAQTSAENSLSAMIVGVCTHPLYRNKGYATMCVAKICYDLLNEGKTLCLFYFNPNAGKIYKKLGFCDIGIWSMYKKG